MIRLIAVAGFALAVATSAEAMTPAPILQPDGIITQADFGRGPGWTWRAGRYAPRARVQAARRCAVWRSGVCRRWLPY